jgi:hypothetical protein
MMQQDEPEPGVVKMTVAHDLQREATKAGIDVPA